MPPKMGDLTAASCGYMQPLKPRFAQIMASRLGGDAFDGRLRLAQLGPVRLCRIAAQKHEDDGLHAHHSCQDTPFYKLVFQLKGTAQLEQGNRRTILKPGRWCVYDVSRAYGMRNQSDLDQIVILLPKESHSHRLSQWLRVIPDEPFETSGAGVILLGAMRAALSETDAIGTSLDEALGETLLQLAKIAIGERLGAIPRTSVVDSLRERIETYVLRNLRESDLSVDGVAQQMKCSKRYLHKIFSGNGSTLNRFIWSNRIERCERDLIDPEFAWRSITEIAFSWGFVNSAHFSRVFRARFGASPRAYRAHFLEPTGMHAREFETADF